MNAGNQAIEIAAEAAEDDALGKAQLARPRLERAPKLAFAAITKRASGSAGPQRRLASSSVAWSL